MKQRCTACGDFGECEEQPWGDITCTNLYRCAENMKMNRKIIKRQQQQAQYVENGENTMMCPRCWGKRFIDGPSGPNACPNCQASGIVQS